MGTKEKLTKYLNYKGIKPAEFYKTCGFSNGFLNQGENIGSEKLMIIRDKYLDLNMNWLLYDEGEMIQSAQMTVSEPAAEYEKRPEEPVRHLQEKIKILEAALIDKQRIIELLEDKLNKNH